MTVLGAAHGTMRADAAHRRRTWITQPATLSMLPALSIFVFAQRYLVGGLVGAIRG